MNKIVDDIVIRKIQTIKENKYEKALEFVKTVFKESEGKESSELVKNLVKEIRSNKNYIPELELIMVDVNEVTKQF